MSLNKKQQNYFFIIISMALLSLLLFGVDFELLLPVVIFSCLTAFVAFCFFIKYGLLSWRCGIPIFYLTYFIILPFGLEDVNQNKWDIKISHLSLGIWYACLGILGYSIGVLFFSSLKRPSRELAQFGPMRLIDNYGVMLLLVLIGLVSRISAIFIGYASVSIDPAASVSALAGLLSVFSFFLPVGMLAAWSSYFSFRAKRYLLLGCAGLVFMIAAGFFSNSKAAILIPIVMVLVLKFAFDKKLPVSHISFLVLSYFLFVYPLVSSFRHIQSSSDSVTTNSQLLINYVGYIFSGDWLDSASGFDSIHELSRSLLLVFSKIVNDTGSSAEYMSGDSYLHGLGAFVPRFIFEDKLATNMGNVFGQHYGLLRDGDYLTNISPTMMGEFYANYGIIGTVVGMFIMGAVSVFVDRFCIGKNVSWLLPVLIVGIGWQEATVGSAFLPFVKDMIVLFLFLLALSLFISFVKSSYRASRLN